MPKLDLGRANGGAAYSFLISGGVVMPLLRRAVRSNPIA